MAAHRFSERRWEMQDRESAGTRSEIVTGPVRDWARTRTATA